jgi:hypothetical protein
MFENRLTRALCVYLGYQRYPIPAKHPEDLTAALGSARAEEMIPRLDEIVAFAVNLTVGAEIELGKLADNAAHAVRRKYRSVGKRGRRAVAWYVTHHWR